jgi:hypothetical protein
VYCGVDDEGAIELFKAAWPALSSLNLEGNPIGLRAIKHLSFANFERIALTLTVSDSVSECTRHIIKSKWQN